MYYIDSIARYNEDCYLISKLISVNFNQISAEHEISRKKDSFTY